jgi:hypothetical protein
MNILVRRRPPAWASIKFRAVAPADATKELRYGQHLHTLANITSAGLHV